MSKFSLDKFLEFARRSKLIEPERLDQVVSDWKREVTIAQLDDANECAAHLVDAGLLTPWQAHKLLEGRHRGFQLGKYKLLGHLGSGGMSSVYLAEHTLMHRLAAVKVLPQHRLSDASYVARFHLEGQSTAALDHPNIVRVYDLDSDGKIHYLVMEYIEGRDLEAVVAENGPMDPVTAADYVVQAAAGLDYAHQAGLVHRDVKPANLLVDRQGVVKILDMGLAKFAARGRPRRRWSTMSRCWAPPISWPRNRRSIPTRSTAGRTFIRWDVRCISCFRGIPPSLSATPCSGWRPTSTTRRRA